MIVKEIYEAYETELLNQSELFFNNILKNFSIKEMDKELFLTDYMLKIYDYLILKFTLIHYDLKRSRDLHNDL
ncbi:MAG: hypothetical protein ACM34O_14330 [Ignavibacteria bacterium]